MKSCWSSAAAGLFGAWVLSSSAAPAPPLQEARIYSVRQSVLVSDIPPDARKVCVWISLPEDDPAQQVLDVAVLSVPGEWKLVSDGERGARFIYVETPHPGVATLTHTVGFSIRRRAVLVEPDPGKVGALSESQRRLFAEELRLDAPHMAVTERIRRLAGEVCGGHTNPAIRARRLLDYVADHADHYSKNPSKPTCGVGDAENCLANGGGCCTDLHSLFIAMARAVGLPARLQMGYRLQPKNAGVEADPGYRCWVEYFLSGYGWVPSDVVEAQNAEGAARFRWLSGLTERRIRLNQGREFDLPFKQHPARVNLMTIGYAEIDGKPVRVLPEGERGPQLTRRVFYVERTDGRLNLAAWSGSQPGI